MKQFEPVNDQEKVFCNIVEMYQGIGYGRMKQLITGIWAKMLMRSMKNMSEKSALLGALDLDTWIKATEKKQKGMR